MNLLELKNIEDEESVDVSEFSLSYIDWLNNSGLLKENGFQRKNVSNATFDSNTWILYNDLRQNHDIYDFKDFEKLISEKYMTQEELIVLKCWLVSKLKENYALDTILFKLSSIKVFINGTKNFNNKVLNSKKGDVIYTLIKKNNISHNACYSLREYLDFLDSIGFLRDEHVEAMRQLKSISIQTESKPRKIPSNKDILTFSYYLYKFFDEEKDMSIVNYYKPLLLWWKITNVIPMRPSEFAFKLKRDCLIYNNDEYYLKIDRIKVKNVKHKEARIPILKRIGITKDIYNLILEYINLTSFDLTSETLISYESMLKFRKDYCNSEDTRYSLRNQCENKGDKSSNNLSTLSSLLNSFYTVVIEGFYKEKGIKTRLTIGDTRHLAFSSLVLQGVSPIEIAMIGGHTTLSAQDNYTGHTNYYVDSEILDFVNNRNIPKEISDKNLIKIIFSKPPVCPKILADCHKTEDGVGHCTLDIHNDTELCDNVPNCIYCKKWWCEPCNESYLKVKHYLETSELQPLKATIEEEEQCLVNLLKEAKVINIGGLLELNKEYESQISTARLKLKSSADKLIMLKKSILEFREYEEYKQYLEE